MSSAHPERGGAQRRGVEGRWGAHRRHHHGPLFWRIYLYGVVLLVAVGIAVAAVGIGLRRASGWVPGGRLAQYAAERAGELSSDPARLGLELRRVRDAFGVEASVYAADGRLVATSAADPARAPRPGDHRMGWSVPLPEGGVLAVHTPPHDPARSLLFVGAVLVALAVASYPLARSIAAPVERLTAAARALGDGELSARANVRTGGELGALGNAFDEMAARLERLVRGERELLANVSHELRTPLARIRVALELAAEGEAAGEEGPALSVPPLPAPAGGGRAGGQDRSRRYLSEIAQDLEELDRLIEDVLATARLDAAAGSGLPARSEPVELAAVLDAAAARFRTSYPGRTLSVGVAGALPALRGDPALLRRLVANLLDNAAKYSEPPAPVALRARAEAGAVVIEVEDRGIGIAPQDAPRLFTPFFRTDRSRARGTGGTGLGLALAKRIAEAHGGTISAESAAGAGTVFRVTLPAVAAA